MKKSAILLLLPLALIISACTSNIGANQYDTDAVGDVSRALKGTVVSVRAISVSSDNGAGTLIGGAAGGVAGSMIGGSDTAHILGAIGGGVVGGNAGNPAQGGVVRQRGTGGLVQTKRLRVRHRIGQRQHGYRFPRQRRSA